MNLNILFFFKKINFLYLKNLPNNYNKPIQLPLQFIKITKKCLKKKKIFKNSTIVSNFNLFNNLNKFHFFFFFNRFLLNFIEILFKEKVIFNLKKGTNKLILKQMSFRKFTTKYFKRHLKITKQLIGILYYSFLLKDSNMFINYFKIILERTNLKKHKKLFSGLRKLIKDLFKPIFDYLGVYGIFFNVKGKIGTSGNAKKKRYFFYFGKHSITNKTLKVSISNLPI